MKMNPILFIVVLALSAILFVVIYRKRKKLELKGESGVSEQRKKLKPLSLAIIIALLPVIVIFLLNFITWTSIFAAGLFSPNLTEPEITSGEFPFVIEYEFEGETYIIEDTVVCSYEGNDPSALVPTRSYSYDLKNNSNRLMIEFDANTESLLTKGQINEESRIVWYYGHGGYYLGDPKKADSGPCINYVEICKTSPKVSHHQTTKLTNEQLEELFGIKIIRFEFSTPIENTFE